MVLQILINLVRMLSVDQGDWTWYWMVSRSRCCTILLEQYFLVSFSLGSRLLPSPAASPRSTPWFQSPPDFLLSALDLPPDWLPAKVENWEDTNFWAHKCPKSKISLKSWVLTHKEKLNIIKTFGVPDPIIGAAWGLSVAKTLRLNS